MKTLRCLLIVYSLTLNYVNGQSNEQCLNNLSIFAESAKIKNYDTAYDTWLLVLNDCPKLNLAIYTLGERILKHKIKNSTSAEQESFKEDLINLYDKWIVNFPNRKGVSKIGSILSKKAQALIDYKLADDAAVYAVFDDAYKKDATSFTNPKGLYNYFDTLYKQYKITNTIVSTEHLFNMYEEISEKFEYESTSLAKKLDKILIKEEKGDALSKREIYNKRAYNTNSKGIATYLKKLNQVIINEASCENLIPLYERNFEENKTDSKWLNRAARRMSSKDCSDDPLFVNIIETLHRLDPGANSAYYLGLLNDKKGKASEALKYYEESISLESDPYKKAKILYKIAVKFSKAGRKQSSRRYAKKALKNQPSMGKAHLLIAGLYASSANDCGDSTFNKRAIYWLAADTARKAGRVDASIRKSANKTALSYMGRAPSKTDIFSQANEGTKITFNCWVGGSVTVPKL